MVCIYSASTAPTFKALLLDRLEEATWPLPDDNDPVDAPQISWGDPVSLERECVALLDIDSTEEFAALGAQARDETYTLNVWVIVANPGATAREATERAYALFDVVAATVREFPVGKLQHGAGDGQPGTIRSIEISTASCAERLFDSVRWSIIESKIRVKARI